VPFSTSTHLDENTLASLLGQTLSASERRSVDSHLDGCSDCRALVAELVRTDSSTTQGASVTATQLSGVRARPLGEDPALTPRYRVLSLLGRGGMGEVWAVHDSVLNRTVALKRMLPQTAGPALSRRFLEEARRTAQLQHPSIIPIHELGTLSDQSPYFTMKRVEGRALREVLSLLRDGDRDETERFGLSRLCIVFLHVTEALGYAHARGVLHCDLKPGNILLGEHGEVLVTDWGLARTLEATDPAPGGTPLYMSPEQVRGDPLTEQSDVWGLGALLYTLLTLHPPFEARTVEGTQQAILQQPLVPPRVRAPERAIPEELEALCVAALAKAPAQRPGGAGAVQAAVERFLSGERRRALGKERFAAAEQARVRLETLEREREKLEAKRVALAEKIKGYDPEPKKAPLWAVEAQLEQNALARDEALAVALDGYGQAVAIDETFIDAGERLAKLHAALFLEAERQGDRSAALFHRRQLERHDRGAHRALLSGEGHVRLRGPPGARATLQRVEEQGKLLLPSAPDPQSRLPLPWDLVLPRGSYLVTLELEGFRPTRLSVFVDRETEQSFDVTMVAEATVGPGFVLVPAGEFISGGDPTALNSAPWARKTLPDFFIARTPVTCTQYLAFLNALLEEGGGHQAQRHVPRTKPEGGYLWERGPDGRYFLPKFDADGDLCHPEAPVMGVSFEDAEAFANWRSRLEGAPVRLPTEDEWEKAARGADGRFFPWGNGFDPTFCKMAQSRPGRPQPEPVGAFPRDTSVYGVSDCAGGIREWCDSFFDEARQTRVLRGGAWYFNPHYCRLAFRHGYLPHIVFTNFGFRLCRDP
jgi:eukaryotic-like serine/threonine-protein kinase